MIRIGILGSDNSHALMFSKIVNIPDSEGYYQFDDVRITAIYGFDDDPMHTEKVAKEGRIEFIAKSPEEFYGKVDAVMVVYRHGKYHVPHILPFVEKGYPVWIDKPISTSIEDIEKLREAVERNNTLITGGSTLKYNHEILTLQRMVENKTLGEVSGGSMNFPGDFQSEYNGIFFYGSHLCEMCLSVFGYDVKSVYASSVNPKNTMVIAKYEDKQVALHFNAKAGKYTLTLTGEKDSFTTEMDTSIIYKLGFEQFIKMLRIKRMPLSFDDLVKPVYMLSAIEKSIKEGKEISL